MHFIEFPNELILVEASFMSDTLNVDIETSLVSLFFLARIFI